MLTHLSLASNIQIRAFPVNSECGTWTEQSRVFANCFHDRTNTDNLFGNSVQDFANSTTEWLEEFGSVFDKMITSRNDPTQNIELVSLGSAVNSRNSVTARGNGGGGGGGGNRGGGGGGDNNGGGGRGGGGRPPNRNLRQKI